MGEKRPKNGMGYSKMWEKTIKNIGETLLKVAKAHPKAMFSLQGLDPVLRGLGPEVVAALLFLRQRR
jgi:hypothetical protein